MTMLVRFSGCCFKSNFSLLSWSEFISFDRDNCFAQCVAIVGSQYNFVSNCPKNLPTPNCLLNDKSSSYFASRHLFHFATITIWFRFSFHNWKCENPFIIIWTVIICWKTLTFGLLLSGWDILSNHIHVYTLTLIAHLINETLSILSYWSHLIL